MTENWQLRPSLREPMACKANLILLNPCLILISRFRWVFCQLDLLRHCLAPSLRDQLNALPKSLDDTYKRVLYEIQSTNQGRHAHRLLQCITVAMRPLRVEELAEVLAFELDSTEGEPPRYHPDWRWEDQEHAVLSACSSLITIVNSNDSRVIQFSHFSVKEYLTSERLSTASGDVSQYHIAMEPAHLILARSCLGVLLNLVTSVDLEYNESSEEGGSQDYGDLEDIPLLNYAAEHWTSHAEVGNVSSYLKDALEALFEPNKPYFEAWIRIRGEYDYNSLKQSQLYIAALHGFYDLVQHLIDRHPDKITHHGSTFLSPLVGALVSQNHILVAELLVKHGAHVHIRGDPPLCHVISSSTSNRGRVNSVQFLLKNGALVNAGDSNLMTPLHYAAEVGCPNVARLLLEHGADVGLQNDFGQVPLHLVSGLISNKDEDERLLLARLLLMGSCAGVNAQDFDGKTPLHYASDNRRPKIVQLLLAHGANAQAVDYRGHNPLHDEETLLSDYKEGPHDVLKVTQPLLEQGVDINVLDENHETPLHIASSLGLFEKIRVLLDLGAKANLKNIHGQVPLHLISQNQFLNEGNVNVTRLLLQQGTDVNTRDKQQATPLHFASFRGYFEITRALLDHGADVNARNADGQTPLHRVSMSPRRRLESGYKEANSLAQLMLVRGADVNARDKDLATPLHSASYVSNLETTHVLLDNGANIHAKNVQGQTPLHIVSQGDYYYESEPALVELLLSRGVDVNVRDKDQATPLLLASFSLKPEIAEKLLQNAADVNAVNIHGQNALHLVSQNPHPDYQELGRLLLEAGVDLNGRDSDGRIPLHLASFYGQVYVAEVLLEYAAQINATDTSGHTPLHQVTLGISNYDYKTSGMQLWDQRQHPARVIRLAELLLEHGADVNAQNKDHETPLHLASRLRLHEMARFLLNHGAKVDVMNSEGKTPLQLATRRKGKAMRRLLSEYSAKHA